MRFVPALAMVILAGLLGWLAVTTTVPGNPHTVKLGLDLAGGKGARGERNSRKIGLQSIREREQRIRQRRNRTREERRGDAHCLRSYLPEVRWIGERDWRARL